MYRILKTIFVSPYTETLKDKNNIERTATRFDVTNNASLKFFTWTVIRTRAVRAPKKMEDGLFNNSYNILTFIALGNWGESDGIFTVTRWSGGSGKGHGNRNSDDEPLSYIELTSGEDVSVNGADTLFWSGKEGGLALMLRFQVVLN